VHAFENRCAHRGTQLSTGWVEGDCIRCFYHGWKYDATGQCVRVPSHPDGHIPPGAQLRPVPLVEADGLVWVWPGDPAKAAAVPPPRIPELADPMWDSRDVGGAMAVIRSAVWWPSNRQTDENMTAPSAARRRLLPLVYGKSISTCPSSNSVRAGCDDDALSQRLIEPDH